jgi:predicted N-acyltransferase
MLFRIGGVMIDFDVQIVHGVDEIGQAAWDRLGGGQPFTSYRWYRFGEKAMAYAMPVYILLSREGELVARATCWLTGQEPLPIQSTLIRKAAQAVFRRWPLLMCQSPLSSAFTSGLILPDPPLRDRALEMIVQHAREQAREHRASFCLFPYLMRDARKQSWPDDCMWVAMSEPGTRLAISWPDFESYLSHLNKKRRYNYHRTCRLADELGIQVKCYQAVLDVDRAMALHEAVNRRYRSETEPWMRRAFENAHMVDSAWLCAEVDGHMVGCELMLGDGGVWFVTGLGLDYSVQYAYFKLSYADIGYAIASGAKVLRWGAGAYEVKRRLGFEVEDNNYVAVVARTAELGSLGRWLAGRAEDHVIDSAKE